MNTKSLDQPGNVVQMGSKFETLTLVDRLIEENQALRHELNLKTRRLRKLQLAVHAFLMTEDGPGKDRQLNAVLEEKSHEI
ncbi:hypothetical protein [Limnobacter sp.]|uniref:hypothetical protein n=1 Tax=Limnobacter sp. TaxID=2003368 RepID=UPI00258F5CDB|nr:hypothetical protein [Limnobacter sp.]HEX5485548.1 hypothetical protein [Limnobacter sp.]